MRFVAASLVVLHHCWTLITVPGQADFGSTFEIGAIGVDIFFVISGFLMIFITAQRKQGPVEFFVSRLLRVGPPYWVVTGAMVAMLIYAPRMFGSTRFNLAAVVTSLAFVPWPHPTDGGVNAIVEILPIMHFGWTLNYEMAFYSLFAMTLFVAPKYSCELSSVVILALVFLGLVGKSDHFAFEFYSSPIMLEFVFGMIVGKFYVNGFTIPAKNAVLLFFLAAVVVAAVSDISITRTTPLRWLLWGVPSALMFFSVISLEKRGSIAASSTLRFLGDSSYSVYLTQLFTLGGFRLMWRSLRLSGNISDTLMIGSAYVACIGVGMLFHIAVETPLVRWATSIRKKLFANRVSPDKSGS